MGHLRAINRWILVTGAVVGPLAVPLAAAVPFEFKTVDADRGKVEVVDVDGDGRSDLIKKKSEGESLAWFRHEAGPGSSGLTKHVVFRDKRFRSDRLGVADLDGDGDLDLVTGLEEGEATDVIWLENPRPAGDPAGYNAWAIHTVGPQDGYIKDIGVADFNGDGRPDIVTRAHTQTVIYFQRTPTRWTRQVLLKHESHEGMDVADLDRDGDPDIVLNGFWYETPADAERGTYTKHVFDEKWFTPVDHSWRDNNAAVKVADVNGDALADIIISHSELPGYPIAIYTAASTQAVLADRWQETHVAEVFDFCQTLDAGDIDNDGDVDILAAKFERDHQSARWENEPPYPIVVFTNADGQGTAWDKQVLANDGMYAGVLGDVGSDGDLDVVGPRSYWTGPVKMWENVLCDAPLPLDRFTYIQIDDRRDKRYFGLAFADVTRDGYVDILAGKWFYRNPGGDMTGAWERVAVDDHVDALLVVDVDGDAFADFIGLKCNEQYWYEAKDVQGRAWTKTQIGTLPICDHKLSTQYYSLGQMVPGGRPEIVLARYVLEIPAEPDSGLWPATQYAQEGTGYAVGDIDGDGLPDIAGSYRVDGEGPVPGTRNVTWWCSEMCWWKNPGEGGEDWERFDIGKATHADRYELADMNGDGRLDLVTTEERYPGHVPNGSCYWFEQPGDPTDRWRRHLVVTQMSMNNLDAADMDRDGDMDIITCEHSMPYGDTPAPGYEKLEVWENDGAGHFARHVVDRGKESHLGARTADLDHDGDLDIVSIAWRDYQYLHLWRNDAINDRGAFVREHWAAFDPNISNYTDRRWRINDGEASLHPRFGKRWETRANGLILVAVPEDLFGLRRAELYLELWGGHAKLENKRFTVNGRNTYLLPRNGTEEGHCTYSQPTISLKLANLVTGVNALQFTCDRGQCFWGHYIVHTAAVRCYLKADHPDLTAERLDAFEASVVARADGEQMDVRLSYPEAFEENIACVDYLARYQGFDDGGLGREYDWHGFTLGRKYVNHVGSADKPPFAVTWDTRLIADQGGPLALRAIVSFKGGIKYETPILDGLALPRDARVRMFTCSSQPVHFSSRVGRKQEATITLPEDISNLARAQLIVKIWGFDPGTVKEPFKINGHPYDISRGERYRSIIFSRVDVSPEHLKPGENRVTLLSDTEHHGIEVFLPGPVLMARFE